MPAESERFLSYAEVQANHPDQQLRPLLALIFGQDLPKLREAAAREVAELEAQFGDDDKGGSA